MGNCEKKKEFNSDGNKDKIQISKYNEIPYENINLITNNDKNIIKNKLKKNFCIEESIEKKNSDLYEIIQEISSDVKSIKNGEIKLHNENIKNNHYFSPFPFYNGDYVLEQMRNEWIEKEKEKYKNLIKGDIKDNIIDPEIKNLNSEIIKINEQISINNDKIKLQITNEINDLKKIIETEKEKDKVENNNKIENLTKKIEEENKVLKNEFKTETEKLKNDFDSKISNLINQINIYKTNFEKFKNESQIEIENLKEQIKTEKKEKEALKTELYLQIKNNKNEFNSKLKDNKEENNKKFEELKKKVQEIDILNKQIEALNEEQTFLKIQNEEKGKELKNLDQKINDYEQKLNGFKNQIYLINNTLKQKTIKLINGSFRKFGDTLNKLHQENKCNIKQQELKKQLFFDKNYARVGLDNIGNNCYINSVLQILKNIPKFTYYFFKLENNEDKFICSFRELLINLCKSNISSFNPKEFKKNLGIENKKFAGNSQYDSTIFYISLLNIITKKLNNPNDKKTKNLDMNKSKNQSILSKFQIYKDNYYKKHTSFVYEFFYLFYSNKIICKSCQDSNEPFQSTCFLDFPISTEKGPVESLEQCFENFQAEKELEDECTKCHSTKIVQNFIIYELPPVLMINLKRIGENTAYLNEVKIPFKLNMGKIIHKIENNSIYELRGFIKHEGDENSGHNFSFCKNMFDNKWYEYNDSNCIPINGEPKLDKIFFLCYIKIGSDVDNVEYLKQIV